MTAKASVMRGIIKHRLIERHIHLVRAGRYVVARKMLYLLQAGHYCAGLCDTDWELQTECEKIGCHIRYTRTGNWAHISY